uniref:Uncharacterized protein n=1 Tax=Panagrolaimus superbus TaxID=310955 RepID=A0A914YFX2_9BILA
MIHQNLALEKDISPIVLSVTFHLIAVYPNLDALKLDYWNIPKILILLNQLDVLTIPKNTLLKISRYPLYPLDVELAKIQIDVQL